MSGRPAPRPRPPTRKVAVADGRLWGRRVRTRDGWVEFVAPDDDEGGATVPWPLRPSGAPPVLSVEVR